VIVKKDSLFTVGMTPPHLLELLPVEWVVKMCDQDSFWLTVHTVCIW
jgi:hypothetical protein